jgi:hypothetical protein
MRDSQLLSQDSVSYVDVLIEFLDQAFQVIVVSIRTPTLRQAQPEM